MMLKVVLWHLYTYMYMNALVAQKHIYVYTKIHLHICVNSERKWLFLRQWCQSCKALQLSYEKIWPLTHMCLKCVGILSALFCRFYKTIQLGGNILSIWNILRGGKHSMRQGRLLNTVWAKNSKASGSFRNERNILGSTSPGIYKKQMYDSLRQTELQKGVSEHPSTWKKQRSDQPTRRKSDQP